MPTSDDRCPACGISLRMPWSSGRRARNHEAGSKVCQADAWDAEVQRRGLIRCDGLTSVTIAQYADVVYGPVRGGLGDNERIVIGAFAETWVGYIVEFGADSLKWRDVIGEAIRYGRACPEFAEAVAATGAICSANPAARRTAVMQLVVAELRKPATRAVLADPNAGRLTR